MFCGQDDIQKQVSWYTLAFGALLTFSTFSFHLKVSDKCQRIPQSMLLGTQAGGWHLFPERNRSQRVVWGRWWSPWSKYEWIDGNEMRLEIASNYMKGLIGVLTQSLWCFDTISMPQKSSSSLFAKAYFCNTCGGVPLLSCCGDYCARQCCPSGKIVWNYEWVWILRRILTLANWVLDFRSGQL